MIIDPVLKDIMLTGSKHDRHYICQKPGGFLYFALYYFDYFTYPMADFHFDMVQDTVDLLHPGPAGLIDTLMWMMFREAAKSVWSRMFICYLIALHLRDYINWDSFDKINSEQALFDVTQILQTNKLLIADYGHLYTERRTDKFKTLKGIKEFITVNKIKVEAFTTQQSTRGRIYGKYRPDFYVVDDFETNKTKVSMARIKQVNDHINEMKAGLGVNGKILFNCNYITESGVVQSLLEAAEKDPRMRIRRVDVEVDGKPTWGDKYVSTDKEAAMANFGSTEAPKVSLESKKRTLNATGEKIYETEMLNSPEAAGDLFFDRGIIDQLIEECKNTKPVKTIGTKRLHWKKYNASHMYAIGADTSKGVGRDANASFGIDFGPEQGANKFVPEQVLSFADNEISDENFASELAESGEDFGEALVAPETNGESGGTCITQLKHVYKIDRIYHREASSDEKDKAAKKLILGWETNSNTKYRMMSNFRQAIQERFLIIHDVRVLREARAYTQADVRDSSGENTTKHFDLLKAGAICWQMKFSDQLQAKAESLAAKNMAFVQPKFAIPAALGGGGLQQGFVLGSSDSDSINGRVDPFTGQPVRGL